jgi:microcystin-dependent protein
MFESPYLGFVIPYAGTTPPANWLFCLGQELQIAEYDALYSLIGNTFGGDGSYTFALPNLTGRVAVHAGQSPELQQLYIPGQTGGQEKISISVNNLPLHSHQLNGTITAQLPPCANKAGDTSEPAGHYPAIFGSEEHYSDAPDTNIKMGKTVVTTSTPDAGGGEQVEIMSPFVVMNYIICTNGLWPSQG